MASENERLATLLKENKITQDEYKLLYKALEKPSSVRFVLTLLINPYQKIAGLWAFVIGIGIILIISYLGSIAKIYFPGLLGILNASMIKSPKMGTDFLFLLYQNTVIWAVLTGLFILAAKFLQQKGVRIIDFMGTVALSRFPYLILTGFLALMRTVNPRFMDVGMEQGLQLKPSILAVIFSSVVIICAVWHIVTYLYALKESSGLSGKKLWISFIACILIGEIIANFITMMLVSN
ncbi:MAG: hypothetical protein BGO43_01675 [Gammaproteobacteria bacterium 39-13]|nr:hypothetical protein [Gammaproteobacteria bacterium]OJV94223.1 MAG: hypothetical protein BGO43_01675 [Gammaproteobacteria bacterium 39-13]